MNATEGLEEKLQSIMNDPNSMAQILSLAQSLGLQSPAEPAPAPPSPPPGGMMPDLSALGSMMGLLQQAQQGDEKQEALLCALKPFLRPERREGIDRAMQLAKLSQLASFALKNGGLLDGKGG